MNEAASAPAWLDARLRAYAQRVAADTAQRAVALGRARGVTDPQHALELLRAGLLNAAPETAVWTRTLLAREGTATDPARPLAPQRLPVARGSMAVQKFRRTALRRALATLVLRPLAALTRRVQPLGGRVAE